MKDAHKNARAYIKKDKKEEEFLIERRVRQSDLIFFHLSNRALQEVFNQLNRALVHCTYMQYILSKLIFSTQVRNSKHHYDHFKFSYCKYYYRYSFVFHYECDYRLKQMLPPVLPRALLQMEPYLHHSSKQRLPSL